MSFRRSHPHDARIRRRPRGTLRVVETAHGLNGDASQASGTTGVVLFNDLSAKPVTQIPDGTVNATVPGAGSTAYIGGSFDTV